MDDNTWCSLRHWGRLYRSTPLSAQMFAQRIREAVAQGASWADIGRAARVTPTTARKYGTLIHDTPREGVDTNRNL